MIAPPFSLSLLCLVAAGGCVAAAAQPKDADRVRACVEDLTAGRGDLAGFSVTYDDIHGLHGGLSITIFGDGKVEQHAVRTEIREARQVSRPDLSRIVSLLRELKAWEQLTPERKPIPDESRARLTIRCRGSETTIWEWYNDMTKNARMARVKALMIEAAWPPVAVQ